VTAWLAAEPLPANPKPLAADAPATPRRGKGRKPQAPATPEPPPMRCGSAHAALPGPAR